MFRTPILLLISVAFLSACGGGSSGDSPNPTPPAPPTPPPANQAPTVTTSNLSVNEGDQVVLSAMVNDSDGTVSTYSWTQTSGESVAIVGSNTNIAGFTAPQSNADQQLEFSIQITDDDGAMASSTLVVTIANLDVTGTLIGINGGTVVSDDGELTLQIPANALLSDTLINIRSRDNSDVPQEHIPEGIAVTRHYQFSPEGLVFELPAIATIPNSLRDQDSGEMPITWLVSGRGEGDDIEYELLQNIAIDYTNDTISGEMLHFSSFIEVSDVERLLKVDIVNANDVAAYDLVGGDDRFLAQYELQLDTKNLSIALETRDVRGIDRITFGESLSIGSSISTSGVVHETIAEPIIFNRITNDVQISSAGEISGQCDIEDSDAFVRIGDELNIYYAGAANLEFGSTRLGELLFEESLYSIFIIESIEVDCLYREEPIPPSGPLFIAFEGVLPLIEGMVILSGTSLFVDSIVNIFCPQILVAGQGGTALADACTGEVLNSFVNVEISEQANFQTSVLIAPEGEPEQINFIQNQRMLQLNPENYELFGFAMLLDFSFGNPQTFLDITNLGGDKTKGAAYVAGSPFVGILSYSFEFSSFVPQKFTLQDNAKSVVANADGTQVLIVNSNNELVSYDLSGEQAQRTLVANLGDDVRRIRCNFDTNVCSASDFSLNLLKTFVWDGQTAPTAIVDTETVAEGPVEMSMQGNKIAVAGFRDDKLSILTVSNTGEISESETFDLPAGCQGPGHVEIIEGAVIVSCNLSNNILYLPIGD